MEVIGAPRLDDDNQRRLVVGCHMAVHPVARRRVAPVMPRMGPDVVGVLVDRHLGVVAVMVAMAEAMGLGAARDHHQGRKNRREATTLVHGAAPSGRVRSLWSPGWLLAPERRLSLVFTRRSWPASQHSPMRLLALVLALGLGLTAAPSLAGAEQGRTQPLAEILKVLEQRYPGRALHAEMRERNDRQVYQIKWLGKDGRVREVLADAESGEILRVR
jgi:hypothetical protein